MDELLAPHTKLPVIEAEGRTLLEPNHIYLCPPGMVAHAEGAHVYFALRPEGSAPCLTVNIYFKELAEACGEEAIGVVLSGAGADGSEGVKKISDCGGKVFVQDPADAEFAGMPQSAISTGCVRGIAPAGEVWSLIAKAKSGEYISLKEPGDCQVTPANNARSDPTDGAYEPLFAYLNDYFHLDFSNYRIQSLGRRIERRMGLLSIETLSDYLNYLKESADETACLYKDLLIGVTCFFRDKASFQALAAEALTPALKKHEEDEFRVWVAGCATGEEAYSLYILASEVKREVGYHGRIRVFATDVFKASLDKAGNGAYAADQMQVISEDQRERYFEKMSPTHYKVRPEMRKNVVFARHDFLIDAPFTNIDLVSCRNVLIYLKPQAQETALSRFSYALRHQSILFLGGSESFSKLADAYETISSKHKIFRKDSRELDARFNDSHATASRLCQQVHEPQVSISRDLLAAYDSLLEHFGLCGFLITEQKEILHYFGSSNDYCLNISGRPDTDLLNQLDVDLKLAVSALLNEAIHEIQPASSKGIHCRSRMGPKVVDVSVNPLKESKGKERVYLVQIAEHPESADPVKASEKQQKDEKLWDADDGLRARVNSLEEELRLAKTRLDAYHEELGASNEARQATEEEMEVSNEELQSTNEELRSLNEELTSLNAEYEGKNQELIETNLSYRNLLESTEDGVLFVDRDLRIRKYNPAIAMAFNLWPSDIGRPLQHIAYHFQENDDLAEDVRAVMATGKRSEEKVRDPNGRSFLKRINPFRLADDAIDGALLTFTDTTRLDELENRFDFAIEAVGMSWWDWDLSSGALNVYSAGACLLGEGCLDTSKDREGWMALVHPDDREEVERSLEACLCGESREWDCEHRFKTTQGEWLWVRNRGRILNYGSEGQARRIIGTTQDIDTYKRSVDEATYQRELLEDASEIAGLGVWEYDPDTRLAYWSEQVRTIHAVDDDFDPNVSLENAFSFYPQPDRQVLQTAFTKLVEEGIPYDLELHFVNQKGERLLIRTAGRPQYDENGRRIRIVGLFQDITEIKRKEHEMEAYFAMSPDFQATLDMKGCLKTYNPSWNQFLGYSETSLSGAPLVDFIHREDLDAFSELLAAVKRGQVVNSYETRVYSKEMLEHPNSDTEEEIWMSWSFSSDEQLGLIFVSARCVSEQKKAKKALETALVRAEEANRAKIDFLGVMSHELRTPLNPILGFADLLLQDAQDAQDAKQREILQMIVDSGKLMVELIDGILDFTKIDAGKTTVDPVEFDLGDFTENICKLMRGQTRERPVELKSELDEGPFAETGLPVFYGDDSLLQQILRNLVGNALKFTEEGEVVLRVSILSAESNEAEIRFEVADTGIGIPAQKIKQVFEPFTQVDSSTTRSYGGTGLGLSICKKLVRLLKGTMDCESTPKKGSVFRFTIPLQYHQSSAQVEDRTTPPKQEAGPEKPRAEKKHRILVVEDNATNTFFIEQMIKKLGSESVAAASGEEALEILASENFDLILLDLHMPGMGGMATLQTLRHKEKDEGLPRHPVVILTADVHETTREECLQTGADSVVAKPVKLDTIRQVLEAGSLSW